MGWSYGIVNGRKVGYAVRAKCDKKGCKEKIDRGLAYVCGGMHGGGEYGCGGYFCENHLRSFWIENGPKGSFCLECAEELDKKYPEHLEEFYSRIEAIGGKRK